jgi:hypothetical protein
MTTDLPVLAFQDVAALRSWLEANHATSAGILVRIYKRNAGIASVTFEDVLDEGLCFGWSESRRLKGDAASYQRVRLKTPPLRAGDESWVACKGDKSTEYSSYSTYVPGRQNK